MRLIDTETLQVVGKRDDECPRYAILSHTWGSDEEEVTLQDMRVLNAAVEADPTALSTHPIALRPGYTKIRDAARIARSENWDYVWVDTCCIDKTSSAELSEAINSMFRYYQEAEICYAFLNDVDYGDSLKDLPEESIMRSRWFTRGWTLQELIAPLEVRFYSRSWGVLGSKGTGDVRFLQLLERVTGIDMDLLDGTSDLNEFGVAARMKWASRRVTTRTEDRAYCLMGIFGVNMPLLYGEGKNAFIRLQEAILGTTDDQSIFAWKCPPAESEAAGKLSGLLAHNAAWFEKTGHIKPLPSNVITDSSPWGVTNAGLRVSMALFPLSDVLPGHDLLTVSKDLFAAVLDCSPYRSADLNDTARYRPTLVVLWLGGNQYARYDASRLLDINYDSMWHIDVVQYKEIFVRQNPAIMALPEIYLDDEHLLACPKVLLSLSKVWGPGRGRWHKATRTFRCKSAASYGILCIFRYTIIDCTKPSNDRQFDVIVGLLDPGSYVRTGRDSFWCHVQPARNSEPEAVIPYPRNARGSKSTSLHFEARIYVGTSKTTKHNNMRLILQRHDRRLELPDEDVSIPEVQMSNFPLDRPWTMGAAVVSDHPSLVRLLSPFVGLLFDSLERAVKLRPGPVRVVITALASLDCESAFQCSRNYMEQISNTIREIVREVGRGDAEWANPMINPVLTNDRDKLASLVRLEKRLLTANSFRPVHGGLTLLHVACMLGHHQAVEVLLADFGTEWANVLRETSSVLEHPLSLAVLFVRDSRIKDLIMCWKSLYPPPKVLQLSGRWALDWLETTRNGLGETVLHRAAVAENIPAIETILSQLTDLDDSNALESRDNQHRTPLWHAAASGAFQATSLLLSHGADANTRDAIGLTALHAAIRAPHDPALIASALLSRGAEPNAYVVVDDASHLRHAQHRLVLLTPAFYAAMHNGLATLMALVREGATADVYHMYDGGAAGPPLVMPMLNPLHVAAANGYLRCAQVLCAAGFNRGWPRTPLQVRLQPDKKARQMGEWARERAEKWVTGLVEEGREHKALKHKAPKHKAPMHNSTEESSVATQFTSKKASSWRRWCEKSFAKRSDNDRVVDVPATMRSPPIGDGVDSRHSECCEENISKPQVLRQMILSDRHSAPGAQSATLTTYPLVQAKTALELVRDAGYHYEDWARTLSEL